MSDTIRFTHETYISPFSWRYGSAVMRELWSEKTKRLLLRRVWVALARAERVAGLVTAEQVADLEAHAGQIDIARAEEIEAEIQHDVMAEIRVYAEQCPEGGGIIHLGATSMDVLDNAEALRVRMALDLLLKALDKCLGVLADRIERWADLPAIAFTHLQPAEPTTVGYRLAQSAQDLLVDYEELKRARVQVRGKGVRGAVGTSASYGQLLEGSGMSPAELSARVLAELGLQEFDVVTQTYPRKQDWLVLNALAGLAGTLYKFAFDLRLLQSPGYGEWSEPFGRNQVGSSAMPFKRNPITAEKIDSLARYVAALPRVAWDNAAHSLLERTLDDSANRRVLFPNAFLACDEMLRSALRLVEGLVVDEAAVARNLSDYGVFAATERLLMEASKAGGDRQALHEVIREHSLAAWEAVKRGDPNPLADRLADDPHLLTLLPRERILRLLSASRYVGDAPDRARALAGRIRCEVAETRVEVPVQFGEKLAEGKTKVVYAHPADPALAYLVHKDSISAGDGARRNVIEGKGRVAGRTMANVCGFLSRHDVPTHYVSAPADDVTLVRRCSMIPIEVVMRRVATGSYLNRHPETAEGTRFGPPLVEFFLKDDARHDPQITGSEIVAQGIGGRLDVERFTAVGRQVFELLEKAWAGQGVQLVDLKIEFGRPAEQPDALPVVADVIDNDSWRLWPGGQKEQMLDKQVYRNMQVVTDEGLSDLLSKYCLVAEMTGRFE